MLKNLQEKINEEMGNFWREMETENQMEILELKTIY